MGSFRNVLVAGFAMFAMFFGSGNLVFPLYAGTQTLHQYPFAIMGLLLTAVVVPFLGLMGMVMFDGDHKEYFASLGPKVSFLLILIILSLLGPFGVVPRCITVAYGGVQLLFPNLSLDLFGLIFCLFVAKIIWLHDRIVSIIGSILTPLLLLGIVLIIAAGFWQDCTPLDQEVPEHAAFLLGFRQGYHTMDLLAAFFFSITTVEYMKKQLKGAGGKRAILRQSLLASFIGAGLLGLVYVCFIALGAQYASELVNAQPEQYLTLIAMQTLGGIAKPVVSITIGLACLTTAAILTTLFGEFFSEEVTNGKLKRTPALLLSIFTAFLISRIGFASISVWLQEILEVVYPALIALAIANLLGKPSEKNRRKPVFWIILGISITLKALMLTFG
tara:strand:+ start:18564 stop:19727 length:1164 start_codon:yes stop_codon:yes gene_type:complete